MKCPNCGEELNKDQLYCEHCGHEICIVPEFDPEVDYHMNESMSEIMEDTEDDSRTGLKIEKREIFKAVSVIGIFILAVLLFVLVRVNRGSDYSDELKQADALYQEKKYPEALAIYEKLLKYDDDGNITVDYAECLYAAGNYDKAVNCLYAVINRYPEHELAYAVLISMYEEHREFEELNHLLMNCKSEQILDKYKTYMSISPDFSVEGGTYRKVVPLVLSSASGGEIFYSLDGSNPEKDGLEYTSPIYLKNGKYHVKAVCINDYGIVSEIAEEEYTIVTKQPEAPRVTPDSGTYHSPMLITVETEKGVTVYYTQDGSIPTDKSLLYAEPIPMKEGTSNYHFIAIDESGICSEITDRSYHLSVEATLTADESVYRLKHRLIEREMLTDMDGHSTARNGRFIYVYDSLRMVNDKVMYVIAEYYTEDNKYRNMTGVYFAIDVSNGYVYKLSVNNEGTVTLDPI